jgi:hypothetical protein
VLADPPARRADPALPVEAAHPRPGSDGALLEVGGRLTHRAGNVVRLHVPDARVREPAVVALAHYGNHDVVDADPGIGRHRDRDGAVVDAADGVRRGEVDRSLENPPLPDLERAGQLAGAVEHGRAGRQRQRGRNDGRHTRPLDGDVTDGDADVGDRVPRSGSERTDHDAVVAWP